VGVAGVAAGVAGGVARSASTESMEVVSRAVRHRPRGRVLAEASTVAPVALAWEGERVETSAAASAAREAAAVEGSRARAADDRRSSSSRPPHP
jgi:hypothetical protein